MSFYPGNQAAALVNLTNGLRGVDDVFYASAIAQLGCGHLRPTNTALIAGWTRLPCLLCPDEQLVTGFEVLDAPEPFPHPDVSTDDLPGGIDGHLQDEAA